MTQRRLTKRPLTIPRILAWARAYREAAGKWPSVQSGVIAQARFESWHKVDKALRRGGRGLPGGSSLAQLLSDHCGARNRRHPGPLTVEQLLAWADEFHQRTGSWPSQESGRIRGSGGETWGGINRTLGMGGRGLPGQSSLAQLLADQRGKRNRMRLAPLSEELVLRWADAHYEATGDWPTSCSGCITGASGEGWRAVDISLKQGCRGLPGGSSLALLLAERRGARNVWTRPCLSIAQILEWADAYHKRSSAWPKEDSGPISEAPEETWLGINMALRKGNRGLPRGSSLARLLATERGVRNPGDVPSLTHRQILAWADAHFRRFGHWPRSDSGPIQGASPESWSAIDSALYQGLRGLQGGSSLARLLASHRRVTNKADLPRLSKKKILAWADAHFQRTGFWPNTTSGHVHEAPHENWKQIDGALRRGGRGLVGTSTLMRLLIAKGRLPRPKKPGA